MLKVNDKLIFQVVSWDHGHQDNAEKSYTIYMCGTTNDNKKICVTVTGFKPYFYLKIPKFWNSNQVANFMTLLKTLLGKRYNSAYLDSYRITRKHKFNKFTDYKKYSFIKLVFNSLIGFRAYENILSKKLKKPYMKKKSFQLYESKLAPYLRFIHKKNLESCGWCEIERFEKTTGRSNCDIEIETSWRNVEFHDSRKIAPLIVASFDLECISDTGGFPIPENENDFITQIGTTFSRYGEDGCFLKHVITLKGCSKVPGVVIESYNTEKSVLLAWSKLIKRINPDIITGFNIFQFDYKYIKARVDMLGIENEFCRNLSRLRAIPSVFTKKELNSSALGDNFLTYYDMPGRVQIDIMKVVQRDHKLVSYSLDNVTSEFIKEKIILAQADNNTPYLIPDIAIQINRELIKNVSATINTGTIITSNTDGLDLDSYIKIFFNDNFSDNIFDNNKKYKVVSLGSIVANNKTLKTIIVTPPINKDIYNILEDKNKNGTKMNTVYWTQAKDDLKYSELFEMQKNGTDVDRAVISKYCAKDCSLCNALMSKLEILQTNIAMATVTNVPLSYIFLKGQGIKIFSLVAKKCRQRKHLIPTLKPKNKTKEELEEEDKLHKHKAKIARKEMIERKTTKTYTTTSIADFAKGEEWNGNLETRVEKKEYQKLIYESDSDDDDNSYFKKSNFYNPSDGYEGAIVLDPVAGIHHAPTTVLDYRSLYPSSMIEGNTSHECLVLDMKKYDTPEIRERYNFYEVTYNNTDLNKTPNKCIYAQMKGPNALIGILPEVLLDLLDAREVVKELMEKTEDYSQKRVYEGRQLAYKVTANSLYGQTGATTSPISQKKIAASTTSIGRNRLLAAKKFTEEVFPLLVKPIVNGDKKLFLKRMNQLFDTNICENVEMFPGTPLNTSVLNKPKNGYTDRENFIESFKNSVEDLLLNKDISPTCIYGDSIVGNEPLLLLDPDGVYHIKKVEDLILEDDWKFYNNFKSSEFDAKFVDILNYIFDIKRNYFKPNLKMFQKHENEVVYKYIIFEGEYIIYFLDKDTRILYDIDDRELVIKNLHNLDQLGDIIMDQFKCQLPTIIRQRISQYKVFHKNNNIYDVRRYNLILLDEKYNQVHKIDYFINLIISVEGSKQQCVSNYKVWTDEGWKHIHRVIRHRTNKKIYRVRTRRGIVDVTEDHSLLDSNKMIIKPTECKVGVTSLLHHDFMGMSTNSQDLSCMFKSDDKIECMERYLQCLAAGIDIKLEYDKLEKVYIINKDNEYVNDSLRDVILSIDDVTDEYDMEHYVYDLETDNGHFAAGIGSLILKNTDSIFINFNIYDRELGMLAKDKNSLRVSIKLGMWCSRIIGCILPYPQDLQYEKTFWPFIIITKKRYVGKLYTFNTEDCYQKSMGLALKRRDYAPISKIIVGKVVNTLLNDNDPSNAVECTREELYKILSNKYPIDKYILSKTLKAEYKNRNRIVHAVLADRIGERNPGNKPMSNDRIPYVYIVTNKREKDIKLQGERVEDPGYVMENGIQLDYLFYITNQILKPTLQFLEYVMHQPEKLFEKFINYELNRRTQIKSIAHYFNEDNDETREDIVEDPFEKFTLEIADKESTKVKSISTTRNKIISTTRNKIILDSRIKPKKKVGNKVTKNKMDFGNNFDIDLDL